MNLITEVKTIVEAIEDKLGFDIVALDINTVSSLSDCFIIATANSESQIKAISEAIELKLKNLNIHLKHSEGKKQWVLLDFGNIVVHLFNKESREFYNLERIWSDAVKIKI